MTEWMDRVVQTVRDGGLALVVVGTQRKAEEVATSFDLCAGVWSRATGPGRRRLGHGELRVAYETGALAQVLGLRPSLVVLHTAGHVAAEARIRAVSAGCPVIGPAAEEP